MSGLRKTVLCVVGAFILFVGINSALALSCDPNSTEPDFFVYGLCFSPYKDGQSPPEPISIEQIRERLAIITRKSHTQWIRTYDAMNGLENIPAEANRLGLNVAMGIWIRDSNNRQNEIDNLIAACHEGYANIAVVGNEELWAHDHNVSDSLDTDEFIDVLRDVNEQLNVAGYGHVPIAIAEPFDTLFDNNANGGCDVKDARLINAVDVIFVNIFPYHELMSIDIASASLVQRYECAVEAVHKINPYVQVMIGETGWPSEGLAKRDAEPSLNNLARYFSEVSRWAADNNVPLFYLGAFDEKWKEDPDPNHLYTLIEGHWGIWDSKGRIKHSFISTPVLCETFDPPINDFYVRREGSNFNASDPNVQPYDLYSDGHFLRLLYDNTGVTHFASVAYDRIAVGAFPRIVVDFDFRLYGPDANDDADGFAFLLIPTLLNGIEGRSKYDSNDYYAEKPQLSKTFGVGFNVYGSDKVYISWDGKLFPDEQPIQVPIDLDNGNWHHVKIDLRAFDINKALVTMNITPNIHSPDPCTPIVIVENLEINDPNHPYQPYENRVEFAGRNGGLDINADIDNIFVSWRPGICISLSGDFNNDCKVDLFDLAMMANNWLVDCNLDPDNPACMVE